MDNRIANDMISSGMIPSGKKNKEDLSRTQYGSAPSPDKLMDAYKSMYEHHQKDKDGNTIPHEGEEITRSEEYISELSPATLGRYVKKSKNELAISAMKGDVDKAEKRITGINRATDKLVKQIPQEDKKDMKEDVDLFDVVSDIFVAEGYEKKDAYKVMSQLTEEQLNEVAVTGTIATLGAGLLKGMLGAGKVAAAAGKGLASAGKAAAVKGMGAAKSAASGLKSVAKTGMTKASDALGKVSNIAKDKAKGIGDTMTNMGKSVGDEVKSEIKRKILQGNDGGSNKITKTGTMSAGSYQAASADLFDIVKGQLLDEGMSEEEIKDIMLTLTPDEIMEELSDIVKRNDAINLARAKERAKQKEVPQNIRDASKRQMKAGTPREDPKNPYTTQDKKDIINYNKNRESM